MSILIFFRFVTIFYAGIRGDGSQGIADAAQFAQTFRSRSAVTSQKEPQRR